MKQRNHCWHLCLDLFAVRAKEIDVLFLTVADGFTSGQNVKQTRVIRPHRGTRCHVDFYTNAYFFCAARLLVPLLYEASGLYYSYSNYSHAMQRLQYWSLLHLLAAWCLGILCVNSAPLDLDSTTGTAPFANSTFFNASSGTVSLAEVPADKIDKYTVDVSPFSKYAAELRVS